jgi:hypothetical protein
VIILFTIRAKGGRQGSRTLIPRRETALAERPGKPYPATFRVQWTAGESNPDLLVAGQVSSRWTSSPFLSHQIVPEGVEPPFPLCKRGVVAVGPRDVASEPSFQ